MAFDITEKSYNNTNMNPYDYIDVLAMLNAAIADGDSLLTVILIADQDGTPNDDSDDAYLQFRSSEVSNANLRPMLIVPEPATMGMLALGGLALLRRRRR